MLMKMRVETTYDRKCNFDHLKSDPGTLLLDVLEGLRSFTHLIVIWWMDRDVGCY
jgi:hypothetical protein